MSLYQVIGIYITIVSLFAYVNHKFLRLPSTVGVLLIALLISIFFVLFGNDFSFMKTIAQSLLGSIDFKVALLDILLGFLLFAGAMQIDLTVLISVKKEVIALALFGTIISTFLIGTLMYFALMLIHIPISYLFCLLFGAIISPTDPVAVLAILKNSKAPVDLEMKIAGESLFNDGVGIVLFVVILSFLEVDTKSSFLKPILLFIQEAGGGIIYGIILGYLLKFLFKGIDNLNVLVLLTLAAVTGGYDLALWLQISGPIAMAVAGLIISTRSQKNNFSTERLHLSVFWEIIDEILNISLFVLIGIELILFEIHPYYLLSGIIAIPIVLFSRMLSVWFPVQALSIRKIINPSIIKILTWGGLRGGLAIAMALSIPDSADIEPIRRLLITTTYVVVIFSILVQGLSFTKIDFKKALS